MYLVPTLVVAGRGANRGVTLCTQTSGEPVGFQKRSHCVCSTDLFFSRQNLAITKDKSISESSPFPSPLQENDPFVTPFQSSTQFFFCESLSLGRAGRVVRILTPSSSSPASPWILPFNVSPCCYARVGCDFRAHGRWCVGGALLNVRFWVVPFWVTFVSLSVSAQQRLSGNQAPLGTAVCFALCTDWWPSSYVCSSGGEGS